MRLPEQVLPKRRRQIFYDETGYAQYFGASRREGASLRDEDTAPREDEHQDAHEDAHEDANEDTWVTNFMARLAGLVRFTGGRK
jgi:hypothetical protein